MNAAKRTRNGYRLWLKTPSRKGQQHLDTKILVFVDPEGEFFEKWDLLGLG